MYDFLHGKTRWQLPLGRCLALLLLVWFGLATSGCGGDDRTPLVLYSPHGRDLLSLMEERYEAIHPDIDVRWLDMGTQEVFDRLRSEKANPQADVWYGGPSSIFSRAARQDVLEAYKPSWSATVSDKEKDPNGFWAALYRTPTLIVYNSEAISEQDAPADWSELLEERFADQIVIRDPLASGTMRTIFGYIVLESEKRSGGTTQGFDFLRALDGQTREYVHSPALMQEKLVRQEGQLSVWEMTDILTQISKGAPLGYRFPASGVPVIADSVALVKNAKHRAEAEQFLEWIGSEEALLLAAEEAFRLPAVPGLGAALPDWVSHVEATLVTADVDWERLETMGPEWMSEWDRSVRAQGK